MSPRSPEPAAIRPRPTRLPPASDGRPTWSMNAKRMYLAVALCAVVVYLGALWNLFALDDLPIIVVNPLVAHPSGMWRAFAAPYWAADFGGHMYRPLVIAGFALDALVDGTAWFHERVEGEPDRKSTRLNSSHGYISYAVFCLKKKKMI